MLDKRRLERLDEELAFEVIKDNKKIVCYIILMFNNHDNKKDYIIYTDGSKNDDGSLELLASIYNIIDGKIVLEEITTDAEWDMVDKVLEKAGENNG